MAKRIQQRVNINGETRWISGSTQQELFDAYLEQAIRAGIVISPQQTTSSPITSPLFGDYLIQFVRVYKSKQEALTMRTRDMTIRKHILPRLGAVPIGEIKTADIQVWFDELCEQGYARASIQKIRHIISPAFDSAVEDEIIVKNPLKSKRLKINTDKETHHKAIPEEQMNEMRANLQHLPDRERRFAALLCYTGMRLEEILGLRWEDIDFVKNEIYIQRAVIHPKRNQPEIKPPKTKTSRRTIPLAAPLIPLLQPTGEKGFILGGETPLSYQQQKKSFDKIRGTFHLEDYTAHDFRDTCATEWQEAGMPLGTISHLLGHATTTVTEKCYVKFRDAGLLNARRIMEKNASDVADFVAEEKAEKPL